MKIALLISLFLMACGSSVTPISAVDDAGAAMVDAGLGPVACQTNDDCDTNHKCYPPSSEASLCRLVCAAESDCAQGETCYTFPSGGRLCIQQTSEGEACGENGVLCEDGLECRASSGAPSHCFQPCNPLVPDQCGREVECTHYPNLAVNQGFCPIGHLSFDEPCPSGDRSECEGGVCISSEGPLDYRCSRLCEDDCPDGWYCSDAVLDIPRVCVKGTKPDFPAEGESCAGGRECAPGYSCMGLDGCLKQCITKTSQPCRDDQLCQPFQAGSARGVCVNIHH